MISYHFTGIIFIHGFSTLISTQYVIIECYGAMYIYEYVTGVKNLAVIIHRKKKIKN